MYSLEHSTDMRRTCLLVKLAALLLRIIAAGRCHHYIRGFFFGLGASVGFDGAFKAVLDAAAGLCRL